MPSRLQKKPILRIHKLGLGGRDVEKGSIKVGNSVNKAAPFAVQLAVLCHRGIRIIKIRITPTIQWNPRDAVTTGFQVLPKREHVVRLRKTAGYANDRNVVGHARIGSGSNTALGSVRRDWWYQFSRRFVILSDRDNTRYWLLERPSEQSD